MYVLHTVVGWYVIFYCGVSWSDSFAFWNKKIKPNTAKIVTEFDQEIPQSKTTGKVHSVYIFFIPFCASAKGNSAIGSSTAHLIRVIVFTVAQKGMKYLFHYPIQNLQRVIISQMLMGVRFNYD